MEKVDVDQEEMFYCKGGVTLEWVVQGGCGCPIPDSVQCLIVGGITVILCGSLGTVLNIVRA